MAAGGLVPAPGRGVSGVGRIMAAPAGFVTRHAASDTGSDGPEPMRDFPELLILRHGETEWNRAGRLQGRHDSPLTAQGQAQARAQNALLAGLGAVELPWHVSPQRRARDTASIAARGLRARLHSDPRLREIGIGDWAGRSRSDLRRQQPQLFSGADPLAWYDHAPGGEGLETLARRLSGFLADLSGPSVIVTHGITSRVLRCLLLGWPVRELGRLEGGQGVVFRVAPGLYQRLGEGPRDTV